MTSDKVLDLEIINLMMRMRKAMSHAEFNIDGGGISMAQLRILYVVKMHEGIKMTDLAKSLHIKGASATSHIDHLVDRKLLERKTSPDDRRSTEVYLTRRGKIALLKVEHLRKHQITRILFQLDMEDKQNLINLLQKLLNSLNIQE